MPNYEFVCQDCGTPYETRLSMSAYSAGEGRQCPACGSVHVERAFTGVSVITGARSGGGSCGSSGGSGFS